MYIDLRCHRFESSTLAVRADLQWGWFRSAALLPRAHLITGPSARCAAATVSLPSGAVLCNGRRRVGRRHNVGVRTRAVWPLPWSPSRVGTAQRSHRLCDHLERPRRQRGERRGQLRAAVGSIACWCMPLAREHHGDEHLKPLQQRRLYRLRLLLRPVHLPPNLLVRRLVRGLDAIIIAQHSPLRGYSTHPQWCSARVRQRLGGVGGSALGHAQRRTPAQQAANRPLPHDDARAA
jgi:hypothetical protein